MTIPWDTIQRKGESGELTARESDAIIRMAMTAETWKLGGRCRYCDIPIWEPGGHTDDCPITILEDVENTPDEELYDEHLAHEIHSSPYIWYGSYTTEKTSWDEIDREFERIKKASSNEMTLSEYQQGARQTEGAYDQDPLIGSILGLVGEAGEMANQVKKSVYHGHGDALESSIREEVGDCLWYLASVCNFYNWSLEHVANENLEKLKKRYPEGFDSDHSINRD